MAPRIRLKWLDVKKLLVQKTDVTAGREEMAALDGLTATASELNALDGITSTVTELNTLDLSTVGALLKIKKIAIDAAPDGTEQDSGFTLPTKAVVLDVFLDVTTAEATGTTKTIDVGTDGSGSNDPNGFLAAVSAAATGFVKGTLLNTGQTKGALLAVDESGAGVLVPEWDFASGGEKITYTAGSTDWVEFRGAIYVVYIELG